MWLILPEKEVFIFIFLCDLGAFARVKPTIFTMTQVQSW
jgi:hypothetical protein